MEVTAVVRLGGRLHLLMQSQQFGTRRLFQASLDLEGTCQPPPLLVLPPKE